MSPTRSKLFLEYHFPLVLWAGSEIHLRRYCADELRTSETCALRDQLEVERRVENGIGGFTKATKRFECVKKRVVCVKELPTFGIPNYVGWIQSWTETTLSMSLALSTPTGWLQRAYWPWMAFFSLNGPCELQYWHFYSGGHPHGCGKTKFMQCVRRPLFNATLWLSGRDDRRILKQPNKVTVSGKCLLFSSRQLRKLA